MLLVVLMVAASPTEGGRSERRWEGGEWMMVSIVRATLACEGDGACDEDGMRW